MKKIFVTLIFILISLEYVSAESLNMKVDLIEKEILPDDPLRFQVNIFRLGENVEDIYFQYFLETNAGIKFIKSESVAVEKIGSFFRTIELPANVDVGKNSLIVKANINEIETQAIEDFNIKKTSEFLELPVKYINYFFILLLIIMTIFTVFMVLDYRLTYKLIKLHKVSEN